MVKRALSLHRLAKELGAETADIAVRCKLEGLLPDDWEELQKGLRVEWRGQVSHGLAQTIRDWLAEGLLRPRRSVKEREADLLAALSREAHRANSLAGTFGDELEAVALSVQDSGIDPMTPVGQDLVWRAWKHFVASGVDYQKSAGCDNGRDEFEPEIDRHFVNAFIERVVRPRTEWGTTAARLFCCPLNRHA